MSKLMNTTKNEPYSICDGCARSMGWIGPDHAVTVTRGICGYCNLPIEQVLTPTCDFKKPGQKEPIWD